MYTCSHCAIESCYTPEHDNMPKNCPMHQQDLLKKALGKYREEDNERFFIESSQIEKIGYGEWTRVREIIEFSKRMGYHKLGIAFCRGLHREARTAADILRRNGFEVASVICKTGGIDKSEMGIPEEMKLRAYDPMCNPIAQAMLLNEQETEFNIAIGLCVGHDSLFYKYSEAMVTTLVTKDRVLAHNPAGALYCSESYYKNKL